jgi:hypothetical protein
MRVSFKARLTLGTLLISALIFGSGALFFLSQFRGSVQSTTEILLRNDSRTYLAGIAALTSEESGNDTGNGNSNNGGSTLDAPAQGLTKLYFPHCPEFSGVNLIKSVRQHRPFSSPSRNQGKIIG